MMVKHKPIPMPPMPALKDGQRIEPYCSNLKKMIGENRSWIFNEEEILCRKATANVQVQMMVPMKCNTAVLYNAHYPKFDGHPEGRRMYDTFRRHYYWPHMPSNARKFVSN